MAPAPIPSRELLWYHQLQTENRHLLERLNTQQTELQNLSRRLGASEEQNANVQATLSRLEAAQHNTSEKHRAEFEKEKALLKRIGVLEDAVGALKACNESQATDVGGVELWRGLEQRVDGVEKRVGERAEAKDVEALEIRVGVLERSVQDSIGRAGHGDKQGVGGEQAAKSVLALAAVGQLGGREMSKDTSVEETGSERQSSEGMIRAIFEQKRRRPEREKRIPFRPTPPDMKW